MTTPNRRVFLQRVLAGGTLAVLAGGGLLLRPGLGTAAEWPRRAFDANSVEQALEALYGTNVAADSTAIRLKAPRQAENGALVPLEVSTTLPDVASISIIVDKNPRPLVGVMSFNGAEPFLSLNIRMEETSNVRALVYSRDRLYARQQLIRVTVSGYGG
jgi:sulfur-oxidizing protein SoxY